MLCFFCIVIIQTHTFCPGSPASPFCPSRPGSPRVPWDRENHWCKSTVNKMRSLILRAYLFPFLPRQTWKLQDLNNRVKNKSSQAKTVMDIKCLWKMKMQVKHLEWTLLVTHASAGLPWCTIISLEAHAQLFIFARGFITLWNVSRSNQVPVSQMDAHNLISLTFSPGGPLGPGKPWWQMGRLIHESLFVTGRTADTDNIAWWFATHS